MFSFFAIALKENKKTISLKLKFHGKYSRLIDIWWKGWDRQWISIHDLLILNGFLNSFPILSMGKKEKKNLYELIMVFIVQMLDSKLARCELWLFFLLLPILYIVLSIKTLQFTKPTLNQSIYWYWQWWKIQG